MMPRITNAEVLLLAGKSKHDRARLCYRNTNDDREPSTHIDGSKAKTKDPLMHLFAGGIAGFMESASCHPLDTIKTRIQLASKNAAAAAATVAATATATAPTGKGSVKAVGVAAASSSSGDGSFIVAREIIQSEGFFGLYRGLNAVMAGIVPKMAARFWSFEALKEWLGAPTNGGDTGVIFLAGVGSGITEAVLVVTPAEVCKIRMQAQFQPEAATAITAGGGASTRAVSTTGGAAAATTSALKYRDVLQTACVVAQEEGVGALYRGLAPTVVRQGMNQAINFSFYELMKTRVSSYMETDELRPWQHMVLGGLTGGIGPVFSNPVDVVKTRIQEQIVVPGGKAPKYLGATSGIALIAREEGIEALWKGLTPRLMRIMAGQAITFMTYEWVSKRLPDSL